MAAVTDDGDSDYQCDGVADEAEVNTPLLYLRLAHGGGTVALSQGVFTLSQAVNLGGSSTTSRARGGRPSSTASTSSATRASFRSATW